MRYRRRRRRRTSGGSRTMPSGAWRYATFSLLCKGLCGLRARAKLILIHSNVRTHGRGVGDETAVLGILGEEKEME